MKVKIVDKSPGYWYENGDVYDVEEPTEETIIKYSYHYKCNRFNNTYYIRIHDCIPVKKLRKDKLKRIVDEK